MERVSDSDSKRDCNGGVGMEEYLEKLLSQVRCKKARPYISEEIKGHLEEQMEENLSMGMTREEAEQNAVLDMGDPVEVGISLDRIHKPQVAWGILLLVGVISLFGIFIQYGIQRAVGSYDYSVAYIGYVPGHLSKYVVSVFLGFIGMCLIYFVDYTIVARYAKVLGIGIIVLGLCFDPMGLLFRGEHYYVGIGGVRLSLHSLMLFYVPIYGGILYHYRGGGYKALGKVLLWMIIPVFLTLRFPNFSCAMIILICMMIQFTIAVGKGWFQVQKKRVIAGLWGSVVIIPLFMFFSNLFEDYQIARLQAFFQRQDSYMDSVLKGLNKNISLFGMSSNDVIGQLPDFDSDYVFTYICNSYGSIVGITAVALLVALSILMLGAVLKQKNELGLLMGFGCSSVIVINLVINLLVIFGMLPNTSSFFPFLSYGSSNILLCYLLMGMILSVYKYKNVYPKQIEFSQFIFLKKRETFSAFKRSN